MTTQKEIHLSRRQAQGNHKMSSSHFPMNQKAEADRENVDIEETIIELVMNVDYSVCI